MFCANCGQGVVEGMNFCPSCGKPLAAVPPDERPANGPKPAPRKQTVYSRESREKESAGPAVGDDELLWEGSFSGKAMIAQWSLAAVLTLVVVVLASFVGEFPYKGTLTLAVVAIAWGTPAVQLVWRRLGIRYVLTERRFFHEEGVLLRTTNRIDLIDVDDVTVHRNLTGRLVNVGTIVLASSDKTHPVVTLIGVDDPLEVAEMIDQACHRERDRRGVYVEQV